MEKRAVLAVILSILVIIGYNWYAAKFYPQTAHRTPHTEDSKIGEQPTPKPSQPSSPLPPSMQEAEETIVETERFIMTFTNIGGAIKRIELKDYPDSETKEPFTLANVEKAQYGIANLEELYIVPDSDVAGYALTREDNKIIYRHTAKDFVVEKIYTLHNSMNHIELCIRIKNLMDREASADYKILGGTSINTSGALASRYVEANSKVNGKVLKDRKDSMRMGEVSWIALKNKYFSIILKPYQFGRLAFTERIGQNNLLTGIKTVQFSIPAVGEVNHQYLYYFGPIDASLLARYGMGLEETVDFGFFGGISIFLLNMMKFFYRIFHNWGVSIICVTLLINLVLFPLTKKSYTSMKQMQELQPHMEKLREIHKDNPSKLQKEMTALYKQYKVNPMGGCLPLLLQMPLIWAMYQTVMRSIELKGANFLWIKDLSAPDAVPLPFAVPLFGHSINILPILMAGAMVVQQKFSPMSHGQAQTEQQKQQQKMMLFMPVMFGVLFYTMPSGLVLYWLMNTLLMMISQYRVYRTTLVLVEGQHD